ncbi:carbohydrate-binding protein [Paenibacillus sp. yr247]|uniref:carbohydrate-binding protein n=1 Tax=Paenibacillus sp. yr247 TaxID=1761880 RepID=UPI0015879B5A|nr:carbohydrate-binding protein [Paenibacillus sp. yr247]
MKKKVGWKLLATVWMFMLVLSFVMPIESAHAGTPWRSSLYPSNWTPGFTDAQGRFFQDFSYAGYWRGEKSIPTTPPGATYNVVTQYGADPSGALDSTNAIQNAIDAAGAAGGGIVYLPAGTYRVKPQGTNISALWINKDSVVLRGAGTSSTFIYNDSASMRSKAVIRVAPVTSADWFTPTNTPTSVRSDLHPLYTTIPVNSVNGYSVNEFVIVHSDATDAFIAEHGMTGKWDASVKGPTFYRKITGIDASTNTLTIDIPIRYDVKTRDNARVYKIGDAIAEIGIEDLSVGMKENPGTGWGDLDYNVPGTAAYDVHDSKAITIENAKNGWVDNVNSYKPSSNSGDFHVLSYGISLNQSRTITIQNTNFQKPQYKGEGGNGYLYAIRGSDNLVQNATATNGRHNFNFRSMWTSGNVITSSTSNFPRLASDFHMHLSMANLFDNMTMNGDFIDAEYRPFGTVEHGWTTTQSVIWNTNGVAYYSGQSSIVTSKQWGQGYVIGTQGAANGVTYTVSPTDGSAPQDLVEGIGTGVDLMPQSLYLDQKAKRGFPNYTTIPAKIEAEDFSAMSGIQLETTTDTGGGLDVGWIDAGDWMYYNVNVPTAGTYTVQYRVASPNTTGQIQLQSGATVLATTAVPNTGGWQNWQTVTTTVNLNAGQQTLRVYAGGSGFNVNWINFAVQQQPTNLLTNPGFETGDLTGWSEWHPTGQVSAHKVDTDTPRTGSYKLTHWASTSYQQISSQTKTVPNGLYSVSVWVRSGGGQNALQLFAKNYGAAELDAVIGSGPVSTYTKYTIDNIQVTNGTIEIGIWNDANAGNWAAFDDFELVQK